MTPTTNPEFTTMESYEAFADYNDVMELVEELVSTVAIEVNRRAPSWSTATRR